MAPGHVAGGVLVRLAHVDHPRALGAGARRARRRRSRTRPRRQCTQPLPRRPTGPSVVLTLRRSAGSTATVTVDSAAISAVQRPHAVGPAAARRSAGPRRRHSASAGSQPVGPRHDDVGGRRRGRRGERAGGPIAGRSRARSQAATTTSSSSIAQRGEHAADRALAGPAVVVHRPPEPGQQRRRRRRRSTTGAQPARLERRGHPLGHRRRRRPRRAPCPCPSGGWRRRTARRRRSRAGGGPSGSSWTRNMAMRSASSRSPIRSAIAPSPASARRKPRLVGADQRT